MRSHQLDAGVMSAMGKAETAIRVSSNEQDRKHLIRELLERENICRFPTIDLDLSQSGGNQKDDGGSQANNGGSFLSPQDDTDADDQDHRDGQKSQANNGDKGKEPQNDTDDDNQDYMDREESDAENE
ncbi:hypothetical protein FRB99_000573 [Tulasnella sp. 403]|nr:hypothetical protein FRB99_000573 [Tulasnella sp. 403]